MQTAPPIPQTVARHVLWHFGKEGGIQPGSFITRLIDAIAAADMVNSARLAEGFPEYVAAVVGAQMDRDGIANLQKIATGEDAAEQPSAPQCPEALYSPETDNLRRCTRHGQHDLHETAGGTQWSLPASHATEDPL